MASNTKLRRTIKTLANRVNRDTATLALHLYTVYTMEFFIDWGFASFAEYLTDDLDMKYRTGMNIKQVGETMMEAKVSKPEVNKLGYTKMVALAKVITKGNREEWLREADRMSSDALSRCVKYNKKGSKKLDLISYRVERTVRRPLEDRILDRLSKLSEFKSLPVSMKVEVADETAEIINQFLSSLRKAA